MGDGPEDGRDVGVNEAIRLGLDLIRFFLHEKMFLPLSIFS